MAVGEKLLREVACPAALPDELAAPAWQLAARGGPARPLFGSCGKTWGGGHPAMEAEADPSRVLPVSRVLLPVLGFFVRRAFILITYTTPSLPAPTFPPPFSLRDVHS